MTGYEFQNWRKGSPSHTTVFLHRRISAHPFMHIHQQSHRRTRTISLHSTIYAITTKRVECLFDILECKCCARFRGTIVIFVTHRTLSHFVVLWAILRIVSIANFAMRSLCTGCRTSLPHSPRRLLCASACASNHPLLPWT